MANVYDEHRKRREEGIKAASKPQKPATGNSKGKNTSAPAEGEKN